MRKKNNTKFLILGFLIFLTSCRLFVEQKRDFSFIQSVGGIEIEQPILSQDGWIVPVKCDVSGLSTITTKPKLMNSALECSEIISSKNDTAIFLTVKTSVIGFKSKDCKCRAVNVGDLVKKPYSVYYIYNGKTEFLGSFDISEILKDY
jgi:hypothetical protein